MVSGRIAIIPARGGSKRLPRKNIMDFCGRPMIGWTIGAALESRLFDRVIVSTEDEEIAGVAREHGAETPFRREQHFDDQSPASAATIHALDQITTGLGEAYQTVFQLMPNCPLRNADDLVAAHGSFLRNNRDFQISCTRFGWLNPWWALRLGETGSGERLFPDKAVSRSQDLDPLYCPTGAIWIARAASLTAAGTFYGPGHSFEPLPWISAVDIDDEDDLNFARAAYLVRRQNAEG